MLWRLSEQWRAGVRSQETQDLEIELKRHVEAMRAQKAQFTAEEVRWRWIVVGAVGGMQSACVLTLVVVARTSWLTALLSCATRKFNAPVWPWDCSRRLLLPHHAAPGEVPPVHRTQANPRQCQCPPRSRLPPVWQTRLGRAVPAQTAALSQPPQTVASAQPPPARGRTVTRAAVSPETGATPARRAHPPVRLRRPLRRRGAAQCTTNRTRPTWSCASPVDLTVREHSPAPPCR